MSKRMQSKIDTGRKTKLKGKDIENRKQKERKTI